MGHSDELLHALSVVNPIAVTDVVKNALPRQRNCYFSSSDATFKDRYEASSDYDKLRTGESASRRRVADLFQRTGDLYESGNTTPLWAAPLLRLHGIRSRSCRASSTESAATCRITAARCVTSSGRPVTRRRLSESRSTESRFPHLRRAPRHYRPGGVRIKKTEFEAALALPENIVQIDT